MYVYDDGESLKDLMDIVVYLTFCRSFGIEINLNPHGHLNLVLLTPSQWFSTFLLLILNSPTDTDL